MNARDFLRSVGKCFITSHMLLLKNCLLDSSAKSANIYSAAATTVSILLVRKANAKGSVSGSEIAPPSKGGGSDKHLAVN